MSDTTGDDAMDRPFSRFYEQLRRQAGETEDDEPGESRSRAALVRPKVANPRRRDAES